MFKTLYYNRDYSLNSKGEVKLKGELLPIKGGFLEIDINGTRRRFCREWLGLIAHYEVQLPFEELEYIDFVDCPSRVLNITCGKLMVFKEPLKRNDGFRVVPGYTSFLVDIQGTVASAIRHFKVLKEGIGPYGYPEVSMYNADKSAWRRVGIHLVVARAFVGNPDPERRVFVNHKDGNKLNRASSNLEWVTSSENITHAFSAGLRTDNSPCFTRDVFTGDVLFFPSCQQAWSYHSDMRSYLPGFKKVRGGVEVPHLIAGRFELKSSSDSTPWFYNDANLCLGVVGVQPPFEVMNLSSGSVTLADSIAEISKIVSRNRETVHSAIGRVPTVSVNGFAIRERSSSDWDIPEHCAVPLLRRRFMISNLESGQKHVLNSFGELRRFLGIDKRTLKQRLENGRPYHGWLVVEMK